MQRRAQGRELDLTRGRDSRACANDVQFQSAKGNLRSAVSIMGGGRAVALTVEHDGQVHACMHDASCELVSHPSHDITRCPSLTSPSHIPSLSTPVRRAHWQERGCAQVPRFTTMLRTFASEHLGVTAPDAAAQYLQRAEQLEQKRRQREHPQVLA